MANQTNLSQENLVERISSMTSTNAPTSFLVSPNNSSLLEINSNAYSAASAATDNSYIQAQNVQQSSAHPHSATSSSTSSYTFLQIKREPCQVSEITTSNHQLQDQSNKSLSTGTATSSTLTTVVKIETSSPKNQLLSCNSHPPIMEKNNVPVGIAIARKRQQEQNSAPTAVQRDCFGVRLGDLNPVTPSNACANIFFTGNELASSTNPENILSTSNIQNVGRTASSFWQYPSTGLDSVLQMPLPPAGFQYARDPNRGQLVLFPTNTGLEPIPQAYVWPYMHTTTSNAAIQTATPNLFFPPLATPNHNGTAATQTSPFVPFQLFGSNYLATASTTLHHHTQTHGTRFVAFSSGENKSKSQMQPPPLTPITNKINQQNPVMKVEESLYGNAHVSHQSNAQPFGSFTKNIIVPQLPISEQNHQTNGLPPPLPAFTNYIEFESDDKVQSLPLQLTSTSQTSNDNNTTSSSMSMPILQSSLLPSIQATNESHENSMNIQVSKQPEMQDVTIQTDTPIMSEEENTLGPEECVFHVNKADNEMDTNNQIISSSSNSLNETEEFKSKPESVNDLNLTNNRSGDLNNSEDLTGLELLSAASFESNKIVIKQERIEPTQETVEDIVEARCEILQLPPQPIIQPPCEPLGGLNLLCALAEQRIHEEANINNPKSTTPSSSNLFDTVCSQLPVHTEDHQEKSKKKKRKHSKSKSSKKKSGNKKHSSHENDYSSSDDIETDMKSAFIKAQYKFMKHHKCAYTEKQCRSKCNWPDPEDFFKVFESDMRSKLALLTRQYKKKKRKLHAFNKIHKKKKNAEKDSSEHTNKKDRIFGNMVSSENEDAGMTSGEKDKDEKNSTSPFLLGKISNASSKPWNSYGLDILRKKNILGDFKFIQKNDSININCKMIKEEKIISSSSFMPVTGAISDDKKNNQQSSKSKTKVVNPTKNVTEERNIVLKSPTLAHIEKQTEINRRLMLSSEHLFKNKIRVLTHMGGLFYAGYLSPLQPPDVYAVSLDGERGNKSHIMSREEVLKDTILELSPISLDEVRPGTRLCAYWSQQYRCLYPGRAAALSEGSENTINDSENTNFVGVEFDDGDSGKIKLKNIRFLLSDYPNIEYSSNALSSFGKFNNTNVSDMKESAGAIENVSPKIESVDETEKTIEKKLKSMSRKHKYQVDESRKHRKHKKRKKHKKHRKNIYEVVSSTHEDNVYEPADQEEQEEEINDESAENNDILAEEPAAIVSNETEKIVEVNDSVNADKDVLEEDDDLASRDYDNSSNYSSIDKNDENKYKNMQKDNHSKIAAFLPARQLWRWLGMPYKKPAQKGRIKKSFYKSIQRGKEIITVGDSAVFLSTGRPDRPYIGRIESMWETSTNNKVVRVKWFYHPEETLGCPQLKFPGALFESPHEDENDVQTISHKCEVLQFAKYENKFGPDPKDYQFIYDNNDTYYLAGHYNPKLQCLKLDSNTPIFNDNMN